MHFLSQAIAVLLKELIYLHDVAQLHAALSAASHPAHMDLRAAIRGVTISSPC